MSTLSIALIAFVALQHLGFFVLEAFLWTRPLGRKVFGLKEDFAQASAKLAMNMGLYNSFLAAGLIWSLLRPSDLSIAQFFLVCVLVAGVFGAFTVSRRILYIQAFPALITLLSLAYST